MRDGITDRQTDKRTDGQMIRLPDAPDGPFGWGHKNENSTFYTSAPTYMDFQILQGFDSGLQIGDIFLLDQLGDEALGVIVAEGPQCRVHCLADLVISVQ